MKGYQEKQYNEPVKRYCQTLELRDNPELIAEYRRRHSREKAWPEIRQGIREEGCLVMEIYIMGTRLFMILRWTSIGMRPWQNWPHYRAIRNGKIICLCSRRPPPVRLRRKSGNRWRECFTFMSDFKL